MNFKNFSRAQFSKLRNGINGVGEFRYDTISSQHFVSIALLVWKLLGGGPKLYTDTHTHRQTDRQTHTHNTHTHTHGGSFYKSCFFCENAKTRLKTDVTSNRYVIMRKVHIPRSSWNSSYTISVTLVLFRVIIT